MENSKLIVLLKSFNKEEWRTFREFLNAPYFNKRKDLQQLFQYLRALSPEFPTNKLKNELVFKKVFGKEPYDDKALKYVMNYLVKLIERFLVFQKMEKDEALMNNFLLDTLVERQLNKHYKGHLKKVEKHLMDNRGQYENFNYYRYQLADIGNRHYSNQNLRKYDANLQLASNYLDHFYFVQKLKYSCEMLNRTNVFEGSYDLVFIDEVVTYLAQHKVEEEPLIAIYLQIFHLLQKEDAESNFEYLKQLLAEFYHQIPKSEKKIIYLYAINFCVAKIGKKIKQVYYVEECLKLYLKGIDENFLLNNGYLSPWTFKNTIKLGLNLKQYDWAEAFIRTSYKKLLPEFQADALNYNLADLAYRRKKYKEAQHHLLLVEYSDVFYSLGAKNMLLKIYYENQEIEALFALIASFSIYLRRNKQISNSFKVTYLNFTSLLQQILRAKPEKMPKIIEKINATELLTSRNWLLEVAKDTLQS